MEPLDFFTQLACLLLGAPLLQGFIKKMKARLQGRQGPSLLQPYYDLWKLLRKDSVLSEHASWVFRYAPYGVFSFILTAGLFVPLYVPQAPMAYAGDCILVVYLFAMARFLQAIAALDTGSAFGGMGSSREMTISSFVEPALFMALFTVGLKADSLNLNEMVLWPYRDSIGYFSLFNILLAAGFFVVPIAETGRIPVDNPATHLELTMIHEAMILEYSGRALALIEWSKAIKQLIFLSLFVNLFLPVFKEEAFSLHSSGLFLAKLLAAGYVTAWVETLNAKLRLFRVPGLLFLSVCCSFLALLSIIFVR
ncbi:MAG TPA: respiratory chain complex I subunit 1 family protein [Candidatus Hypogeohydataceae bacterium YC41]